ncbi:MAG TPA: AraC family transcriptional regulator, partial [Cytophagales bacterium]|nr:AraC family transcriptional regulator [Cytophagales bacterium]
MATTDTMRRVVFVAIPELHVLDLTGPLQVFSEAIDLGAPFELIHLSPIKGQREMRSASGITFSDLLPFDQVQLNRGDLLFIPGIRFTKTNDPEVMVEMQPFYQWLYQVHRLGVTFCTVCTGAFVLAASGLLNGQRATTHWDFFQDFTDRYPNVTLVPNRFFVEDGVFFSSAGITAGIDLSLHLLEKLVSPRMAAQVGRVLLTYPRRTSEDPPLSAFMAFRNHLDDRVHSVQDYLSDHYSDKVTLEQLAEQVEVSTG